MKENEQLTKQDSGLSSRPLMGSTAASGKRGAENEKKDKTKRKRWRYSDSDCFPSCAPKCRFSHFTPKCRDYFA